MRPTALLVGILIGLCLGPATLGASRPRYLAASATGSEYVPAAAAFPGDVQVAFANSAEGLGLASGMSHTIDLTAVGVPVDALSADLGGIIGITGPLQPTTCDLHIWLRAHDEPGWGNYTIQATSPYLGDRSTVRQMVPLRDGKFDLWWEGYGNCPAPDMGFLINLHLEGYVR